VAEVRQKLAPGTPIEVWCQDEMRVGQKNKLTYRWARKGSRPRATHDQRTQSTYLFGAVCPERGAGAALVLPACNSEAMQLHLDEIATKVTPGAHAIVLLDQAGWHGGKVLKVPSNISLMPLPPRAPELNGQENIWQFMRQNWLSNRVFKSFDDIVDHCCYAWNTLIDQPWKIMSVARRDWATVGYGGVQFISTPTPRRRAHLGRDFTESLGVPFVRLEPYGLVILIGLLIVLPLLSAQFGVDLNVFSGSEHFFGSLISSNRCAPLR